MMLPGALDDRGTVVLALLPHRRRHAFVSRPFGERGHLQINETRV